MTQAPHRAPETAPVTARSLPVDAAIRPLKWALTGLLALGVAALTALPLPAQEAEAEVPVAEMELGRTEGRIITSHGYSYFGDLKYPADFTHFDYVNPDAPKGGEISLGVAGTFDSMNAYSRKGRAGRYSWSLYESLLGGSLWGNTPVPADEYTAQYGLLAERLEYDEGKNWVIFYMRPEARFSDGTPVTAHDVLFSHNLLLDQGLESYAKAVRQRIPKAEVIDDHTIKFYFTPGISRRSLIDQVGNVPVWSKAWFEETGARLDDALVDTSPGSGPYVIDNVDLGRTITYKRNPDYWGWHLPINKGRYNFDTIRLEYFADDSAQFEAFKAGEYTFRPEGNSKTWATGYDFPAVENGWVKREALFDGSPPTPLGIVFNLGKPVLQDKRVREAIALAYNFEWTNESLQYGLFRQRQSFTQDTPLEAKGAPEGRELEILESLGDLVPAEMLTEPARMAHTSDGARLTDRRNLRRAMALLDEAGWTVGDDGVRRNAAGEVLSLEFPINSAGSPTLEAVMTNFANNLRVMGVDITIDKIDPSQYTARQRDRDYDLIYDQYASFLEAGTGLHQRYGSEAAAYSLFNPAGLASPLVDALIDYALETETLEDQNAALMALDRALRHEFFMIPVWYNDKFWVAYWDYFEHPEEIAPYDLGVLDYWWANPEKYEALKAQGALR